MWHLGGEFAIITAAACKEVRDAPQGGAAGGGARGGRRPPDPPGPEGRAGTLRGGSAHGGRYRSSGKRRDRLCRDRHLLSWRRDWAAATAG